jgi:tetratricopeptide (TPR) repeat protein
MSRIDQLIEFLKDTPNDPFLHYAIAQEYNKLGNKQFALEKYQDLVSRFPNYVGTYYHLGKIQIELGFKQEAMTIFETGIKIAQELKEQHSLAELQSARLELLYDED